MNRAPPPRPRSTPTGRTPRNRPATHRRGQKRIQPQSPPPRPARQQTYPPRRGSRRVPFPPRRPLGPLPARRRWRRETGPAHRRRSMAPRPHLPHGSRHLPGAPPGGRRKGREPPTQLRPTQKNHESRPETVPPPPALPDERDLLARAFDVGGIEHSIDRSLRQLKTFQAARHPPGAPSDVRQAVPARLLSLLGADPRVGLVTARERLLN